MLAHTTRLVAKNGPLKYLLSKATLTRMLEKWVMILNEFDIEYVEHKSIKRQVIIGQLAEAPLQSHQLVNVKFLDESMLLLTHQT